MQAARVEIACRGAFFVFATSSVVTPICLPEMAETVGISLSEGGGMETARTLVILAVLLVSGALAQRWGKRRCLTLGYALLSAGLFLLSFANDYMQVVVGMMVVGIGGGFAEALVNPLVTDLHPTDSDRHLNAVNVFYPIGVLVAVLLFGELLTLGLSWRVVFRVAGAAGLVVAALFHVAHFPRPVEDRQGWHSAGEILSLGRFWVFAAAIFLGAAVESALTFWSRSYIGAYLADVPRAGAVGVAVFAGAMAAGRALAARLAAHVGLKRIMIASAALGIPATGLLSRADSLIAVYVLLAVAGLATACFWPSILAVAGRSLRVGSTRLFILLACAGIGGFGFSPWMIGLMGDRSNLRTALLIVPGLFALLLMVLAFQWRVDRSGRSAERSG